MAIDFQEALREARLYAICDLGYLSIEEALPVSRAMLEGGAGILQLRAKGWAPADLTELSKRLRDLCEEFSIPFVVNDHPGLAVESGAHALHLGQDDGCLEEVRGVIGGEMLIGRSTHSLSQAKAALEEGADYIGFGPLFPTPTKKGRPGIGLNEISSVHDAVGVHIPVFCIGGIKPDNLQEVVRAGARRVVIVSHLLGHEDPGRASCSVLSQLPIL